MKDFFTGVGAVIIAAIVIGAMSSNAGGSRTYINNLRSEGMFLPTISGELFTEGKTGRVYTWIEQRGKRMCPRSVYLQANVRQRFKFRCNAMGEGQFSMKTSRSPDTWVKTNALSL